MKLASRLKIAERRGESLIRELKINSLPIDPFQIAKDRGIIVRGKLDTEPGVSGMLLRYGNNFGILYATHIQNEGYQRFSVGHELGHYFLEGHIDHVLPEDGSHASRAGFVSADSYEREADHFSAGLLMPSDLFIHALNHTGQGLDAIKTIANLCRTSLTATAIRYTELTDDAVAVIISTGEVIDYCFLSGTIKSLSQITWPSKGTPVPAETATETFNANPGRIANTEHIVEDGNIMDWLDGTQSVETIEEVIGLGNYGKTLTVLTCPHLVDETYQDEDEDEDANLEERWTLRFRR